MPFVSKAQQRAMFAKASRGEIDPSVVREFARETNFKRLPERVKRPRSDKQCLNPRGR